MPETIVSWASGPNGRGTADILWTCLSTLVVCVWVSLHINMPMHRRSWKCNIRRKVLLLLLALYMPEGLCISAFNDWQKARWSAKQLRDSGLAQWTRAHSFLANMGGIRLKNNDCTHSPRCPQTAVLMSDDVLVLHQEGVLPGQVSELTVADVTDRSSADGLVKAISCIQVLWLTVQCIARTAQQLPLTALEVATLAYVSCTIFNYLMWYDKPLDVKIVLTAHFQCKRPDGSHYSMPIGPQKINPLPNGFRVNCIQAVIFFGMIAAFGAVHCVAWNFHFPTPTEQLLWRMSSVSSVALPPLCLLLGLAGSGQVGLSPLLALLLTLMIVYGTARAFLIIEMFISLRSQPETVYKTVEWSDFLPHFS